jgi:hypothetical protein
MDTVHWVFWIAMSHEFPSPAADSPANPGPDCAKDAAKDPTKHPATVSEVAPAADDRQALQRAYFQALELAEFRGGFLARSSHELRSPLNRVISLHQMILEGLCDSPEEEREFLEQAHGAALMVLEQLDFLTYLSKVQSGRLQPNLQTVPLVDIFDQVKTLTHLQAANRNLPLLLAPPDATVQVQADPKWLVNGLVTLVEVAIALAHRGPLRLSVGALDERHCHLWLEDDRPDDAWQEAQPLPDPDAVPLDHPLSHSLRHSLADALFTAMGGQIRRLEVVIPNSPGDDGAPRCRLQCTLRRGGEIL